MKKETQCVHSGTIRDAVTGGVNSPIFSSSAFGYLDREQIAYPRYFNTPNQGAVVEKVSALEGAEDGVLFSSGMAAMSTVILAFTAGGEHVVMMDELYGGPHALAVDEFKRLGIEHTFTATDADDICEAVKQNTRVVVIESPTNPLLSVIDNTFAPPIYQNPLDLGIDIVVHSGTKYLGGHSDICCGIAVTTREKAERIRSVARNLGGSRNADTRA